MPTKRVDTWATANDVGIWGDKADRGNAEYTRPSVIGGETVDLDKLPKFGDEDSMSSMGDLESPGETERRSKFYL